MKSIISNKQYKYIRSHNTYQNQWNDIKRLLERKTCYYTGSRFTNSENYRRTIDRVDSSKGYVKGNVVACTHGINQIKNLILEDGGEFKLTLKQLQMFVNKLSD